MQYKNFNEFVQEQNQQLVNENLNQIVEVIIESKIPFDVFYSECLMPILAESDSNDSLELILEVENWFQRNMPTFASWFGKGTKTPEPVETPELPVTQMPDMDELKRNQEFQQKHGDTFEKVKKMFIDSLKKAATELQNNVSRYPNARMLVPAIQALVFNASKATKNYEFKRGSSGKAFYEKFKAGQERSGQQNAIFDAINSGDYPKLLNMPDQLIVNAIEGQPEMRDKLSQIAKNINQKIITSVDPTEKQTLQKQLGRIINLTKYGMGDEFFNRVAQQKQARKDFAKTNKTPDKMLVRGGNSPIPTPTTPVGVGMKKENLENQKNSLIESLIRCTGCKK